MPSVKLNVPDKCYSPDFRFGEGEEYEIITEAGNEFQFDCQKILGTDAEYVALYGELKEVRGEKSLGCKVIFVDRNQKETVMIPLEQKIPRKNLFDKELMSQAMPFFFLGIPPLGIDIYTA